MKENNNGEHNSFNEGDRSELLDDEHVTIDEVSEPTYLEETAAEFTHPIAEDERSDRVHHVYGWIALALSVVSFFFIPFLFSIAGIVVGVVARNRRSFALGYSAIVIGALSFIINLFMTPFM